MTTIDRQALGTLSTNILNNRYTNDPFNKPVLPRLKTVIPQISISNSSSITKPQSPKDSVTNAEKLKYRLQLAYYKLRTDQVSVPINDIMKKHNKETSKPQTSTNSITKPHSKKPNVTPSLTRHISLLAASTPLHNSSFKNNLPKKVTFLRSNSYLEPDISKSKSTSLSSGASLSRISENLKPRKDTLRALSSPNLKVSNRSVRIGDLVHANISLNNDSHNTTIADNDATISNIEITPVKGRTLDENGDLLLSSPTKKIFSSTPGSYGAAKSLLQLSLISSN